MNAFLIMLIFFCIYAILAVELFHAFGEGGTYTVWGEDGNQTVVSLTARDLPNGWEYYGTFMRALFTLFQVFTGESWSEAIARPLLFGLYRSNAFSVGIFFVSFILLTQVVMANVVVAVLLEKFAPSDGEEEDADSGKQLDAEEFLGPVELQPVVGAPSALVSPKMDDAVGAVPVPLPQPSLALSTGAVDVKALSTGAVDVKLDRVLEELARLSKAVQKCNEDITALGGRSA